jgi:hypothetical protein
MRRGLTTRRAVDGYLFRNVIIDAIVALVSSDALPKAKLIKEQE